MHFVVVIDFHHSSCVGDCIVLRCHLLLSDFEIMLQHVDSPLSEIMLRLDSSSSLVIECQFAIHTPATWTWCGCPTLVFQDGEVKQICEHSDMSE